MSTTNPPQLFLLVEHIKLSLLERQRALSLNLPSDPQDRQISRSLEQLRAGIDALASQVEDTPDDSISSSLPRLRTHLSTLTSQFDTSSSTSTTSPSPSHTPQPPSTNTSKTSKSVRFTSPSPPTSPTLFPYRDDPSSQDPDPSSLSNPQLLAQHSEILATQDTHLSFLSSSISRQRDLSTAIGDELEGQIALLDDLEEGVDRHAGQVGRARGRLERVGRRAREGWSLGVIVALILILVVLIVVTK